MIIRFHEDLCNTIFKSRFEGEDKNGNVVMCKLARGEQEIIEEKQRNKNAVEKEFKTGFANISINGELFYQTEITDKPTIEYLKNYCDENRKKYWGSKIQEYDPLEESKAQFEEATRQAELTLSATQLDETELIGIAFRKFGFETYKYLEDINSLRLEVLKFAMDDPDLFEEYLNDKNNNTTQSYLSMAMAKGIIKQINGGSIIVWGDNNSEILKVARGKTAIEDLANFLKTAEGREIRNIISEKLKEANIESEVEKSKQPAKKTTAKTE